MKKFVRNIEDFECEKCGYQVTGNGYTNHCPKCLYSKHVDINPGDRLNTCRGLMKPTGYRIKSSIIIIEHTCIKCGAKKNNKTSPDDDHTTLYEISRQVAEKI